MNAAALALVAAGSAAWAMTARPSPTGAGDPLAQATADAESADPARHAHLRDELQSAAFLAALDAPADYQAAARQRLHVDRVVAALARNPAPSAREAFLALTASPAYLAHDERVIGLILASADVRPAPPALVRFWDRRSRPDDGFTPTTVATAVANGSPPAVALLERKLAAPAHPDSEKLAWMRSHILEHRNDLPLLQACERLLSGKLKKGLRAPLVEVLFDYRPGEWFRPASVHSAPPLAQASPESRAQLRRLAKLALAAVPLPPESRAAVTRRVQELDALDAGGQR